MKIDHGVASLASLPGLTPKVQEPPSPFSGILKSMVAETNTLDDKAKQAVTGLLNGSGIEVHDAMIATQKADISFELALQVRNKAVGAYQQMMQMQF